MPLAIRPTGLASPVDEDPGLHDLFGQMGEAAATGNAAGRKRPLVLVAACTFRHRPVRKAGRAPSFDVAKARVDTVRQWLAWMRLREDA